MVPRCCWARSPLLFFTVPLPRWIHRSPVSHVGQMGQWLWGYGPPVDQRREMGGRRHPLLQQPQAKGCRSPYVFLFSPNLWQYQRVRNACILFCSPLPALALWIEKSAPTLCSPAYNCTHSALLQQNVCRCTATLSSVLNCRHCQIYSLWQQPAMFHNDELLLSTYLLKRL